MYRREISWLALPACLALWWIATPASAIVPLTAPSLAERVALAELIAVGKVTAVEAKEIDASPLLKIPGVTQAISYRIAAVAIEKPLVGGEDAKRIRVGFRVPAQNDGKPGRGAARYARVELKPGQEGCFFLRRHPDQPFYVIQAAYELVDKAKSKDYDKELAEVKRCIRLLDDVTAGLESKHADDRLMTAALLIYRYRTPRHVYRGSPKTDPIDATQSKLILAALAEADWNAKDTAAAPSPLRLFLRLDVSKEDGWTPPEALAEVAPAARKWLRDHGGEYRIRRFVPPD